jgi:hypothetical protein
MDFMKVVAELGFPIAAAMGYFVFFVWKWVTQEIKPVISQANNTLVNLIDRIRMLDNDLIRLHEKVETVLKLRGRFIEKDRLISYDLINEEIKSIKKPRQKKPKTNIQNKSDSID